VEMQTVLDDQEASKLLVTGQWWVSSDFEFVMSIVDKIKSDKLKREQSIETILLS
jgi:hypothetical protein